MNPAITAVTPTPALLQVWVVPALQGGKEALVKPQAGVQTQPSPEAAHTGWRALNRHLPRGAFPASQVSPTPFSFFFGGGGLVAKSGPTLAIPWTEEAGRLQFMGFSRQE